MAGRTSVCSPIADPTETAASRASSQPMTTSTRTAFSCFRSAAAIRRTSGSAGPTPTVQANGSGKSRASAKSPIACQNCTEAIALGHAVFIVEGEKDVERLRSLGIPATTNAGGAGKWRAELTKIFAGADVVIIPDNDPQTKHPKTGEPMFHPGRWPVLPGQDHAETVAAALSAVAAKVRVLDLAKVWPDMPLKGDVSDFFDSGGGSAEALHDLVDGLQPWSKRPNGDAGHWEPRPYDEAGPRPDRRRRLVSRSARRRPGSRN